MIFNPVGDTVPVREETSTAKNGVNHAKRKSSERLRKRSMAET